MPDVKLTLDTTEYPLTVVDGTTLTLTLSGPTGPAGLSNLSLLGSNNSWTGTQTFSNSVGFSSGVNFRKGSTFSFDSGIAASFRSALGLGSLATLSDGSTITALNANNISSGTLAAARVATLNQNTTGNAATATAAGGLLSTGGTVVVSSSAAPTTGQVLTATSSAAATWQTPTGGGGSGVVEPTPNTIVKRNGAGSVNATSIILSDGNGFTSTMLSADLNGPRTLTLPDADVLIGGSFLTTGSFNVGDNFETTNGPVSINGGASIVGGISTQGGFSVVGASTLQFNVTGNTTLTLPTTGTLVSLAGSATLTNKTISGASNTLTNIPAANLSGLIPFANLTNTQIVGNANATIADGTRAILLTAAITPSPVFFFLPRANTYPAGTVIAFCDIANALGALPATAILSTVAGSGDTINGSSTLNISTAGVFLNLVSDGTSKYRVQTDIAGSAATVASIGNLTGVVTSTNRATSIADAALSIAKTSGLQTALDAKAPLASPTLTGITTITGSGAASASTSIVSGSVFSGGTTLTTLPKSLIQPAVNTYTGVTGAQSTRIITVVGHAFVNGDTVAFSSLTGGSGLSTNSKYYVINVFGNTFQLSLTSGGAVVIFSTDITAGTITNYAVWNTFGTMLGVNAGQTFTGDLINLEKDGTSAFKIESTGNIITQGGLNFGDTTLFLYKEGPGKIGVRGTDLSIQGSSALGDGYLTFYTRSKIRSESNGTLSLQTNAGGLLSRLAFGPLGVTFPALQMSGTTITAGLADGTAGGGFVASGTFAATGASAASTPASLLSGAVFTGGTGTTNFPHFLIQPTAATAATSWSTAGTVIGVNTASGFGGNLIDLKVNGAGTSAFKVSSGGSTTLGNITTVGPVTSGGALITTPATQSGAGALSVSVSSIALTTTGVANALTLANGTAGQLLTISHVSRGGGTGTAVLTPTTTNGYTTITFTATGDSVMLQYHTTGGWHIVGSRGVTIA